MKWLPGIITFLILRLCVFPACNKDQDEVRLFSLPFENNPDGMDHDLEIQRQRNIFNVQQVEFASLNHLFHIFRISELYHAPAGESGFYFQQVFE